ncbi:MAG: hypothetical protein G8345_16575 [Magnetococcales bacterium]|nr:hypothetical protein [Magnetococcales bacterium]NGZ28492.1 hypothetical protein [Magnetococcales bacterium]
MTIQLERREGALYVSLFHNGRTVDLARPVSQADLQKLMFVCDLYRQHTRTPAPAMLTEAALVALGVEMFNLVLAPQWLNLSPMGEQRSLIIACGELDLLLLPWEVMLPPGEGFLGSNPHWLVERHLPGDEDKKSRLPTQASRLLFFQSLPHDLPPLASPMPHLSPVGTLGGLRTVLEELTQPTLLFLHGHALVRGSSGYFAFCEDDGTSFVMTAMELALFLKPYDHVQGVVLSGREEGHPPPVGAMHAVCRQLIQAVPSVLAWPDAPGSSVCTTLFSTLTQSLTEGHPLPTAAALARHASSQQDKPTGYPGWTLLGCYGS